MGLSTNSLSLAGRLMNVNVTISPGELTAIVGPNGAGKSSLLGCMAGILKPDSGGVSLSGVDLSGLPPRECAQRIGYLAQSPEVAWDVTVETLVALGRLPWQATPFRPAAEDKTAHESAIEAAMSAMDLLHVRSRPMSRLSGGERARVLAARVLAGKPDWILADEPLANLDLSHAMNLIRSLRDQADTGRGVVVVLHDLAVARNHADRVIVLDRGGVAADGPPSIALSEDVVSRVWHVPVRWIGSEGSQALVTD